MEEENKSWIKLEARMEARRDAEEKISALKEKHKKEKDKERKLADIDWEEDSELEEDIDWEEEVEKIEEKKQIEHSRSLINNLLNKKNK